uniref:Uncharacterized protein n=1 Tax=Sphaerodactylus townsendi TaxID=933632 RepID=A0ACB8FTX3_9SAUR
MFSILFVLEVIYFHSIPSDILYPEGIQYILCTVSKTFASAPGSFLNKRHVWKKNNNNPSLIGLAGVTPCTCCQTNKFVLCLHETEGQHFSMVQISQPSK